jgi:capsular polysaccharide biosynthesis protein
VSAEKSPAASRLLWCLRKFWWLVAACVVAGASAPLVLTPSAPVYQADALVFARQLNMNPRVLPRLAEAVFASGAVEARVVADPDVAAGTGELIPEQLSVVAAEDSIVLVVQARHSNPATAARMANTGATAFVEELGRTGAGVGEFALQAEAVVPSEPLSAPSLPARTGLGALGGLVLGLGLVGLIAAVRRPIVSAHDVRDAAGVPLVGTVRLQHMPPGSYPGPMGVRGIATVARWLATVPPGRLLLVSSPAVEGLRHRIFVMCGVALWTLRKVRFEAPDFLVQAIRAHCVEHRDAGRVVHPRGESADALTLVDGGSTMEIIDPLERNLSVVAVAPLGVSRRHLRAVTSDFTGSGLVGVVLVDAAPAMRRAETESRHAAQPSTVPFGGGAASSPELA